MTISPIDKNVSLLRIEYLQTSSTFQCLNWCTDIQSVSCVLWGTLFVLFKFPEKERFSLFCQNKCYNL